MILTNLTTSSISLIGKSNIAYEIKPMSTLTIDNSELTDAQVTSLVNRGLISVTGWSPGSSASQLVTTPYSITQSVVTLPANTSTALVGNNVARRYLSFMVVGANDVTVVAGAGPAVVGSGLIYQAQATGKQGGSQEFPMGAPSNAFAAIASAASTVIVWEGI